MKTESMPALVIHKLTQAQYDAALQAGKINENELYLTPEPDIDLATILEDYVLKTTSINGHALATDFNLIPSDINAAPATHSHITADIDNLDSVLSDYALTTMKINGYSLTEDFDLSWEDVGAAESKHDHDSAYHTKNEISEMFVTVNDSISDIVNGSTVVHSAENDGNGDSITSTYETKTDANQKLEEAKDYADGIKDDLLNGAGAAYDTLKELGDLIDDNKDAIDVLNEVAAGKQATITGAATTITSNDLNANKALVSDASGKVATSNVTSTELGYLSGVSSSVQTQLDGKAASVHPHPEATQSVSGFMSAEDKTQLVYGGIPIVNASSDDGVAYSATINGVTELIKGMKITIIPDITSVSKKITLNVNNLGAKEIRMQSTVSTGHTNYNAYTSWLYSKNPVTLQYSGFSWVAVNMISVDVENLDGCVPITKGGTGATTASAACSALGAIQTSSRGAANGVAPLNSSGKIEANYLPFETGNVTIYNLGYHCDNFYGNGKYIKLGNMIIITVNVNMRNNGDCISGWEFGISIDNDNININSISGCGIVNYSDIAYVYTYNNLSEYHICFNIKDDVYGYRFEATLVGTTI